MIKNKISGFSLAECIVVFILLGIIGSIGIPMIMKKNAQVIRSTQFYEAYRALYEGGNKAKLASPSGSLRLRRTARPHFVNCCDKFTEVLSVMEERDLSSTHKFCITDKGMTIEPKSSGLCEDYRIAEENGLCKDRNPPSLCYDGNPPQDGHKCPDGNGPEYCKEVKQPVIKEYYAGCIDDKPISVYSNFTNFDKIPPNFITLNGLRFYGLEQYPAAQECPSQRSDVDADLSTPPCRQYRNVYVDTDGIARNPKDEFLCTKPCSQCTEIPGESGKDEALKCKDCYDCLMGQYGVFKFRLHNDASVEPLTRRFEENDHVLYKLSYVRNGQPVDLPDYFTTYQSARDYKIALAADQTFDHWSKTDRKWVQNDKVEYPCQSDENFVTFECVIMPATPNFGG